MALLSVQTNVSSLTAQHNLMKSTNRMSSSMEKLSTGLKINKAHDSAAGLVISELQRREISGLQGAIKNIDRANNMVQTAESGLGEINDILLKIRGLAIDAANEGAHDADALDASQAEITELLGTIDRISDTTKFGTKNLLDGSISAAQFQLGAFSGENTTLTIDDADSAALGIDAIDVSVDAATTNAALDDIDAAIVTVSTARGDLGAFQAGTLDATRSNNASQLQNLQEAESTTRDTDYQVEIANYTSEQIRNQVASSILSMANQSSQSILSLLRG